MIPACARNRHRPRHGPPPGSLRSRRSPVRPRAGGVPGHRHDGYRATGVDWLDEEAKAHIAKREDPQAEDKLTAAKATGTRPGPSVLAYGNLRTPFVPDYFLAIVYLNHGASDTGARRPDLVGSRQSRRADLRRRHVPALAVVCRSHQHPAVGAAQPDRAAHHREADLRSRLSHLLAQPRHDRQRSDRAARDRRQRSRVLDSVAQRRLPDLRARVSREAHLLKIATAQYRRTGREVLSNTMPPPCPRCPLWWRAPGRRAGRREPTSPTTSASRSDRCGW